MKIACVLISHLPAKAEQRRHPDLRRRPVIITEESRAKRVVLDSSPEAAGVSAGTPLQEALSRCKDATLLQADMPYYQKVFDRVIEGLQQRSPLVEKAELGCAYVGVDGLEGIYGSEARLITSLLQATPHDLSARLGLACGKFLAYVAAATSSGGHATRVPDDAAGFLAQLPVNLLPISWDKKARLHGFGLHTMGQLASLPVGSVQAQFGTEGKLAWDLANGVDPSPLFPYSQEEAVTEFLTFPSPATTIHAIVPAVEVLLGRAFSQPALRGKYVRTAEMESSILNKPPWTRRFAFKTAINSKGRALSVVRSSLESAELPGALEDLKLTLAGITGESGIQGGFFSDVRRQEQLRETMRQLEARLGPSAKGPPIYQIRDVEPWSRIPERRQALVPYEPGPARARPGPAT